MTFDTKKDFAKNHTTYVLCTGPDDMKNLLRR
jgi:hypothetical protein